MKSKKSFILYLDQQELFNKLPDEIAGKLIKHIFSYVNCEDPETDDLLIDIAFASIKQSLKRDLNKWETQLEQRSRAGKISAERRATKANEKQRKATTVESRSTKSTDSVNVSDSVSVSVSDSEETKDIVVSTPAFNFKNELLALGVDKEVLEDWLTVRKKKKASNTKTALKGLITEITKSGLMVNDAIEYAAEKSWSGFKAQWYFNEQPNQQNQSTGKTSGNQAACEDFING